MIYEDVTPREEMGRQGVAGGGKGFPAGLPAQLRHWAGVPGLVSAEDHSIEVDELILPWNRGTMALPLLWGLDLSRRGPVLGLTLREMMRNPPDGHKATTDGPSPRDSEMLPPRKAADCDNCGLCPSLLGPC